MAGRICSWTLIPLIFLLFGCASSGTGPKTSSSQKFYGPAKVLPTSGTELHPAPISPAVGGAAFRGLSLANFYDRVIGGQVIEASNDQIVVEAKAGKPSSDPVALTNDAIIATSVRAKVARDSKLKNRDFQVTSNDGIVSIRAQQDSLDDALSVINLTLSVPDVREVVYILPTRA
ncbi:MAG: BON domain-containing protein [Verrucomicrobia bacterium]|nr:BON domain-containing protein [Verrucomicrobiota bacterium]